MARDARSARKTDSASRTRLGRFLLAGYVAAAATLVLFVASGSLRLVDRTVPGFLVFDNGIVAAFFGSEWTGRDRMPFGGAVLLEVEGEPFAGGRELLATIAEKAPGEVVRYEIRDGGARRTVEIATMRLGWRDYAETFGVYLFLAIALLTLGGLAFALRPDQANARALWLALGSVGALFALAIDHLVTYRLTAAYHLIEGLAPVAIANLALIFPQERVSSRIRHRILAGLGAGMALLAATETVVFYSRPEVAFLLDSIAYLLSALLGVGMVVSFGEAFLRGRDPAERTRAALVFAGGLVGFLVPACALFAFFVLGIEFSTVWWTPFLAAFAAFLLYAIVRHDLLHAERVIRLTVGYTIATSGMLLAYAGSLALLSRLLWPDAEQATPSFVLVLAVAVSFEPVRRRVQQMIDRAFYRSQVDVARTLEEASAQFATLESEHSIARCLAGVLETALGLHWAQVELGPASAAPPDAALVEPIAFQGEALGLVACGQKRSGAPYSAVEIDLVRSLASQAALATQHARAIRALRTAQEQLMRSERLAAVGEFAGSVAHGIRNPLAGIRAAAQVARQRAGEGPLAESLDGVLAESDRLEKRIKTLLDFSRPYALKPRGTDLVTLLRAVERSVKPAAAEHGVRVTLAIDDAPDGRIRADSAYLEEAILELASNGLRAMPDGGVLGLRLSREDDELVIRVSDTGVGVPEGVKHRLFELFFTTHRDGSGVGLATVKRIVDLHGGRVELERTGPEGTTFRVCLPLHTSNRLD